MKCIITILTLCLSLTGFARQATFDKLSEVNACWKQQTDVKSATLPAPLATTETDWIRHHLTLVEQTLRTRSTAHLTAAQTANRMSALNHLNQYWKSGNFPINEDYSYRTPIFIDKHDNFCAVGYLVKATGFEQVSRKIAAETNLAYVKEMKYEELNAWASEYGFTVDELAWIQPAYPPAHKAAPIGGGTDGEVKELYPVDADDKLYVGGSFSMVDGNIPASNVAYIMDHNGTLVWHSMGSGVNGQVHAIVKHDNKIFVAGAFTEAGGQAATNVAYWDGSSWHPAGCTYGIVNDLVVFNGDLYAVGDFDVCAALAEVNFAKWTGTMWQQIPGLDGHVNTAEVVDNNLVLGGNFTTMAPLTMMNAVKWNPTNGFGYFGNSIANEVMDFQIFKDTLFAACKLTSATDSSLLLKLDNHNWTALDPFPTSSFFPQGIATSYNTLVVQNDTLSIGGYFHYATQLTPGTMVVNASDIYPYAGGNSIAVDSAVNKMVVFKGHQVSGGKFMGNYSWGGITVPLNGIAIKKGIINSIPKEPGQQVFRIYPNPADAGARLMVENNFTAERFILRDVTGRLVYTTAIKAGASEVTLPVAAPGMYIAEISNSEGVKKTEQLIIR